jgi:hypothetical protein
MIPNNNLDMSVGSSAAEMRAFRGETGLWTAGSLNTSASGSERKSSKLHGIPYIINGFLNKLFMFYGAYP